MDDYAKRTQFPKKSNAYNLKKNNELQQKTSCGHLVKTNPKQTQFRPAPYAVQGQTQFPADSKEIASLRSQ